MNDWDKEPYQEEVNKIKCKHCGGNSVYDFCREDCQRAYWSEMH